MHKTVTITIGGLLFHVEEEAYVVLEQYLRSIRTHFYTYPEGAEIAEDIEGRIAEDFSAKLSAKKKVIGEKDVDDIIRKMGTVKDFAEFDATAAAGGQQEPGSESFASGTQKKWGRLYRDSEDQVIAGVCAGIAKYFGIDPVITRLIFGLSILLGGTGVLVYIVLWIALPEAKTTSEKVEMTQHKVTLSAIRERVEQAMPDQEKQKKIQSGFQRVITFPFVVIGMILRSVGKVVRVLFPILGRLVGVAIVIACAFGIAAATFVLLALLLNPSSPYFEIPLQDTVGNTNYLLLVFSGYCIAFVPLLFILLTGASLLSMRNLFSTWTVASLIGLWMIALVTGGVTGFTVAPAVEAAAKQYEAEHFAQVEKPLELSGFTKIDTGSTEVIVTRGNRFSVTLSGTERAVADTDTRISDGTLQLERTYRRNQCYFFCHSRRTTLTVVMPVLEALTVHGSSKAQVSGFSGGTLKLAVHGASMIHAAVAPDTLDALIQGSSHVELRGTAQKLNAELHGASSLGAYAFPVQTAEILIQGSSRAMIDASQSITGELHGASRLWFQKRPATLQVQTHGASRIGEREEDVPEQW